MKRNYRECNPSVARVILLDAVDTVLPPFPESLQRRAHRDLERLGVEVRLGMRVTGGSSFGAVGGAAPSFEGGAVAARIERILGLSVIVTPPALRRFSKH